ncbi:MAG: signal peptidase II [Candidatus Omnitrophica bacterium]|nr:signal peptidase II [Candidatus Omnitrophota bacterium]
MVALLGLVVLIIDQWAKYIVSKNLWPGDSIPVINGIFHITLITNTGGAFGLFKGQTRFFIMASLAAMFTILFLSFRRRKSKYPAVVKTGLGFILGGTLGNLIDRLKYGYVIDFLDFRVWPVFNIADTAITLGTGLLIFSMLLHKKPDVHQNITCERGKSY